MRNRRVALVVAGVLAALAAAAPAQGALAPPEVFGIARLGDLTVVSSVYATRTSVDMRGVWINESLGCDQWRGIRVRAIVSYSACFSFSVAARIGTPAPPTISVNDAVSLRLAIR